MSEKVLKHLSWSLRKMGLGGIQQDQNMGSTAWNIHIWNYCAYWGGKDEKHMHEELEDELIHITKEELEMMAAADPTYEYWYLSKFDDMLLGKDDE